MCSSCPVDARLMCRAACMGMGVSTSRSSLVKDYSTLGDMAPRTNKRVCSTPRRATVSSGTTLVRSTHRRSNELPQHSGGQCL